MAKDFKKCPTCKEYHWADENCEPAYYVYHDEYMGDEPKEVRASSHEGAALAYGRYYNEDDYPLIDGEDIKVKVVDCDGNIEFYAVGAAPDIHYSVKKIENL